MSHIREISFFITFLYAVVLEAGDKNDLCSLVPTEFKIKTYSITHQVHARDVL